MNGNRVDNFSDEMLFFAPLQGLTDHTYRRLHADHFGGVTAYLSPFVRVERGDIRRRDLRDIDPQQEGAERLIPQVLAGEPGEFRQLLEMLSARGYDRVDLNLGCAFPLIARKGKGAGLLPSPERVEALLAVLADFPGWACSVKMRLGWDDPSEALRLLPLMERAGITRLAVHARLGIQEYRGLPDRVAFGALYQACTLPLVYNGDITNRTEYRELLVQFPRLAGVMIGRGLLAEPALAEEIRTGKPLPAAERLLRYRHFHDALLEAYAGRLEGGEHQVVDRMRGLWAYFLPDADLRLRKRILKSRKLTDYKIAVAACFAALEKKV